MYIYYMRIKIGNFPAGCHKIYKPPRGKLCTLDLSVFLNTRVGFLPSQWLPGPAIQVPMRTHAVQEKVLLQMERLH